MDQVRIGVIGGSGVYQMETLTDIEEVRISTPFGDPSDAITVGTLAGQRIAFLPRHGVGHRIMPTEVNSRANIYALKSLGVERIISVTACGSMKEKYAPRHIVIPDQIFDQTKERCNYTFFGNGLVVHIGLAEPFCPDLSRLIYEAVKKTGATVHMYRQWGVDIIGMTAAPEAALAREAEICYAAMAHVTDYDVWHETEESVTVAMLIENLMANAALTKEAIQHLVPTIPQERACECATALSNAVITQRDLIPDKVKKDLDLLIGKYL
jgi:5'-methylthioadenosine phosphorylase